jgi:hypothetical protein
LANSSDFKVSCNHHIPVLSSEYCQEVQQLQCKCVAYFSKCYSQLVAPHYYNLLIWIIVFIHFTVQLHLQIVILQGKDKSATKTSIIHSPFYAGRTTYGGASAYRNTKDGFFVHSEVKI